MSDGPIGRTLRGRFVVLARCALCLAMSAACSSSDGASPLPTTPVAPPNPRTLAAYFPPNDASPWETIAATQLGYDSTALATAIEWAGTQRSTAVVVLWRGRIVAERYWNGWTVTTDSIIASAGKSVLSAMIGELARAGQLALDSAATTYLGTGWSRAPAIEPRITVRQLLGMSSGLDDSLKAVVAPGSRFYYNNPAYYQLFRVAQSASGQAINAMSRRLLFDRIGMSNASWQLNIDTGEVGWILSCSARDMARFGLLALSRGRWNGAQILADSGWFASSWRATPPDNAGYGMLWWLNGSSSYRIPGSYLLPTVQGALVPSGPTDMVAALGKGDKKIYVVPSLELVIVRHGDEADVAGGNPLAISAFDEQWWRRLKPAFRY